MENLPQPNSANCFVCGLKNPYGLNLRFYNRDDGEVTADYVVPEHYQGYPGVVHGGIVAAMLDEAASRSHMIINQEDGMQKTRFMVTARLDIRYRRNVPVGKKLFLVGRAGKKKKRSALASSYIYDGQGVLLAEAEALLIDMPNGILQSSFEELEWKIYS